LIIPLGGLAFGLTASAFRHAPIRSGRWASSFFHLPLRRLLLVGLAFGLTASAFRHAPLRSDPRRAGSSAGRVGLWAHRFRFSACTASELPLGGLVFPPGEFAFGLTASAFRHATIRTAVPPKRGPTEHTDTTLVSLQTLIPTC